jgi:nucleoid-associated protein Lsr2
MGRYTERGSLLAQQTSVNLIDDLTGGQAAETVHFALDGRNFEIDLSKRNAAALRKALGGFVANARKASPANTRRRKGRVGEASSATPSGQTKADRAAYLSAVRTWAHDNGLRVGDRGRIPADILAKYEAEKVPTE